MWGVNLTPQTRGVHGDAPEDPQGHHSEHSGAPSATFLGRHGDAQTVKKNPLRESVNARERKKVLKEEFDNWYQHYPRKVSRGAAEKALARVRREGASLETLIEGAKRYAGQVAGQEARYIKHPATWLNGKCWLDEPEPQPKAELKWWEKRQLEEEHRAQMNGG